MSEDLFGKLLVQSVKGWTRDSNPLIPVSGRNLDTSKSAFHSAKYLLCSVDCMRDDTQKVNANHSGRYNACAKFKSK
jgi:hypothetical protein